MAVSSTWTRSSGETRWRFAPRKIGNRSLTATDEMMHLKSGDTAATPDAVHVLFDLEKRTGIVIDEALLGRVGSFMVADGRFPGVGLSPRPAL